jgi:DNA helicase-2/ATP-dependent DNA helicase PcrA
MRHPKPERCEHAPPGAGLLTGLTLEQAEAVTHGAGPLLLVAGPGAGKTRTLTHRIAYLLESRQARPDQILAVTFSVRAAGELRLRLADLLGQERARGVTAATFHSVCARLLREHAPLFGRTERYTIYDPGDMRRVLDWILADKHRAAVQTALAGGGQPALGEVQSALSMAKHELLSPADIRRRSRYLAADVIAAAASALAGLAYCRPSEAPPPGEPCVAREDSRRDRDPVRAAYRDPRRRGCARHDQCRPFVSLCARARRRRTLGARG